MDAEKKGIVLLWVWIALEGFWLYGYLYRNTEFWPFFAGSLTCLVGMGMTLAMIYTARKKKREREKEN